jgi:hypothetical protein
MAVHVKHHFVRKSGIIYNPAAIIKLFRGQTQVWAAARAKEIHQQFALFTLTHYFFL